MDDDQMEEEERLEDMDDRRLSKSLLMRLRRAPISMSASLRSKLLDAAHAAGEVGVD